MLVAVASALLFDRAGSLRWLVAAVGLAAAVVSVGAYFVREWRPQDGETAASDSHRPANSEMKSAEAETFDVSHGMYGVIQNVPSFRLDSIVDLKWEVAPNFSLMKFSDYPPAVLRSVDNTVYAWNAPELRTRTFADEVVEIVNRLSPTCVDIMPDGRISIHPRPPKRAVVDAFEGAERRGERADTVQ